MPTWQGHGGVYEKPFPLVTASLWSKYDNHEWIKDVLVLNRWCDPSGSLHTTRLLTLKGKTPLLFRPFLGPSKEFYLLEESVIDVEATILEVRTRNVNFTSFVDSQSHSKYTPHGDKPAHWTRYTMEVNTSVTPKQSTFGVETVNKALEKFLGGLIVGNAKMGEIKIHDFVRKLTADCLEGRSKVWLCNHMDEH